MEIDGIWFEIEWECGRRRYLTWNAEKRDLAWKPEEEKIYLECGRRRIKLTCRLLIKHGNIT